MNAKILVFSDTHGRLSQMSGLIAAARPNYVLHLGDHAEDIDGLRGENENCVFYSVRGNCDVGSCAPYMRLVEICGKRVFMTHGHLYSVKSSTERIEAAAAAQRADVALFGHTHEKFYSYRGGLYLINPGSLCRPRSGAPSFALIEIRGGDILCVVKEI